MKENILGILELNRSSALSVSDIHKKIGVNDISIDELLELIKELQE